MSKGPDYRRLVRKLRTRDEILKKLKQLADCDDTEEAHVDADDLLLDYIADEEITAAYKAVPKWYA